MSLSTQTFTYSEANKMAKTNWTEENQKAEFLGGAIAGGCGIFLILFLVIFLILAFVIGSN